MGAVGLESHRQPVVYVHRSHSSVAIRQSSDDRNPADPGDRITHARLEADGALLIAADGHPDYPAKAGDNMAIALSGADKARVSTIFSDLAEGGTIKMPLTEQPWAPQLAGSRTSSESIGWPTSTRRSAGMAAPSGARPPPGLRRGHRAARCWAWGNLMRVSRSAPRREEAV